MPRPLRRRTPEQLLRRLLYVHRFMYERFVGPIPDGYVVDHLCHNADQSCAGGSTCAHRRCANPDHLGAVTQRGNVNAAKIRHEPFR